MNRAFLSLYFVIVASVVLVGWGTDKLWQVYNPEPEVGPFEVAFFKWLESEFQDLSASEAEVRSAQLSQDIEQVVKIYSLEELAKSSLGDRIEAGDIVTVFDDEGHKSSYKRIANTNFIARIMLNKKHQDTGRVYIGLLIAFYAGIGIVIYFWIWPLARDLRKLQNYTQQVGVGAPDTVDLGQRSAVFSLASAFNKMAERIHELLDSHKEMTYAVSHELRTPLARMKFALEMAKNGADQQLVEKQIDSVREDVAEMDKLINELLAYAGFEHHNQQLEFKRGDLVALVENLLANNRIVRGNIIDCEIVNQMPDNCAECEWYLFERCLHNVIQNALKYAERRVRVTVDFQQGEYCVIVEDDGPGIADEDVEKVFQAFVRLRKESDDNKSGFGLGLAIVHRIMKWHDGSVHVAPSDWGGAKFVLRWPKP